MAETNPVYKPRLEYHEIASIEFKVEGYEPIGGFLSLGEDLLCEVKVLSKELLLQVIDKYNGDFTSRVPERN
jgi:hypothetical protein